MTCCQTPGSNRILPRGARPRLDSKSDGWTNQSPRPFEASGDEQAGRTVTEASRRGKNETSRSITTTAPGI